MKAFLGMGLLGSNFVKAMLRKGDQVQVWNRTAAKAKALETDGVTAFDDVVDAVRGVDYIHLTLKDDDTVNQVLELASTGFKTGVIIIDHTTTSVNGAIERTAYWKDKGFTYLHAPVFMGPPNALESTGNMLVSGDQEVIHTVEDELSKMTGKLLNFGSEEGRAAAIKLSGNHFLISLTAGLSDTLALAKSLGVPTTDISDLFAAWNPGAGVPARLNKILTGDFGKPSWELDMARKDAGLMISAAQEKEVKLNVLPAVVAEMDQWIENGHGSDDWSVIAKNNI